MAKKRKLDNNDGLYFISVGAVDAVPAYAHADALSTDGRRVKRSTHRWHGAAPKVDHSGHATNLEAVDLDGDFSFVDDDFAFCKAPQDTPHVSNTQIASDGSRAAGIGLNNQPGITL